MLIDAESFDYEERKMLIKELFFGGNYREGIREATIAMSNLSSFPEKSKYYLSFCKLAAMGYRKIGNFTSAVETINRGIKFVTDRSLSDHSPKWKLELAILHVNLGAVYDSAGCHVQAIDECVCAGGIFEELNDYHHLMMVYETELVSFLTVGNYDEAREIMREMELLSAKHNIRIDQNILFNYSKAMEEAK